MKSRQLLLLLLISCCSALPVKADFGDADFPVGMFKDGPKSYHDAWCRKLKQKCRVRFQGPAMWVEGQGGIQVNQYRGFRFEQETGGYNEGEFYNYISYVGDDNQPREALFLFANRGAQSEFLRAFVRWKKQESRPVPNYRLPASQGPQDTQGRDKSYGVPMNPYERPPITDWKEKTTP